MKKTVLCIILVLGMTLGITGNLTAVDVTLGAKAGPILGFLTGEDWDYTILDEHVTFPVENSFLFGFSLGGGYSFPAGPGVLSFDLRYSRMITQTFQNSMMFPNVIGLYIGYGFTL